MGSPDDDTTVVDPDCRVLGVDGLRVIDASVIPEAPRANLHLTVVMIAEHMAESIRNGGEPETAPPPRTPPSGTSTGSHRNGSHRE
jgi:choline dehydrogenase-like flavoprotein